MLFSTFTFLLSSIAVLAITSANPYPRTIPYLYTQPHPPFHHPLHLRGNTASKNVKPNVEAVLRQSQGARQASTDQRTIESAKDAIDVNTLQQPKPALLRSLIQVSDDQRTIKSAKDTPQQPEPALLRDASPYYFEVTEGKAERKDGKARAKTGPEKQKRTENGAEKNKNTPYPSILSTSLSPRGNAASRTAKSKDEAEDRTREEMPNAASKPMDMAAATQAVKTARKAAEKALKESWRAKPADFAVKHEKAMRMVAAADKAETDALAVLHKYEILSKIRSAQEDRDGAGKEKRTETGRNSETNAPHPSLGLAPLSKEQQAVKDAWTKTYATLLPKQPKKARNVPSTAKMRRKGKRTEAGIKTNNNNTPHLSSRSGIHLPSSRKPRPRANAFSTPNDAAGKASPLRLHLRPPPPPPPPPHSAESGLGSQEGDSSGSAPTEDSQGAEAAKEEVPLEQKHAATQAWLDKIEEPPREQIERPPTPGGAAATQAWLDKTEDPLQAEIERPPTPGGAAASERNACGPAWCG